MTDREKLSQARAKLMSMRSKLRALLRHEPSASDRCRPDAYNDLLEYFRWSIRNVLHPHRPGKP